MKEQNKPKHALILLLHFMSIAVKYGRIFQCSIM